MIEATVAGAEGGRLMRSRKSQRGQTRQGLVGSGEDFGFTLRWEPDLV